MAEDTALQVQDTEKREVAETGAERTRDRLAFVPRADVYETDEEIVVVADMPGVSADSVDITLEDNVLTINGYVEPEPLEGYNLVYAEYRVGDYLRAFRLSDQIDRDGIEATVKDGVLRLRLPKVMEARTRKIEVRAA
ncbi:MAG TPA: Hsp20/alpha crystallin family protein [Anaerolineae bacterium]|nr:Hsp20/alpha crystallin family protein [Anaerolineae bacterium]